MWEDMARVVAVFCHLGLEARGRRVGERRGGPFALGFDEERECVGAESLSVVSGGKVETRTRWKQHW